MNRLVSASLGALALLLLTVEPAWAYLDPGTGSLILQGLTAGVAGVLVVGKLYFARLKSFLPGASSRAAERSPLAEANAGRTGDGDRAS